MSEEALKALKQFGVTAVKLGLESSDPNTLAEMRKPQKVDETSRALDLCRRFDFHITAYLLLGGPGITPRAAERTYDFCQTLDVDDFVVNVWSYHDLAHRDFRYDAHFSQRLVDEWQLTSLMPAFFDLQSNEKIGLGSLV